MNNDLSDNQRRFICRVLFLLVCALPTIAVVYFAAHQRTADQWAQLVQAELGVETSIGGVESPRPGEFVFQDVKLFDDHGMVIFDSLKADVSIGNTNRIDFRSRIEITRAGMSHFLKEACGRLVKPHMDTKPWIVSFHDLEITDESAPEFSNRPFHSNLVEVESGNGSSITLKASEWGRFELARNPTNGELQVAINTAPDTAIPCWLAKSWFPDLNWIGQKAHFSGGATINVLGGWAICRVTGNFIGVDLPYLRDVDPEAVDAADLIQVSDLTLENRRWTNGDVRIMAGNRQVDLNETFFRSDPMPATAVEEMVRQAFLEEFSSNVRR